MFGKANICRYIPASSPRTELNRRRPSRTQETRQQLYTEQRDPRVQHIEARRMECIVFPLPRIASSYLNLCWTLVMGDNVHGKRKPNTALQITTRVEMRKIPLSPVLQPPEEYRFNSSQGQHDVLEALQGRFDVRCKTSNQISNRQSC